MKSELKEHYEIIKELRYQRRDFFVHENCIIFKGLRLQYYQLTGTISITRHPNQKVFRFYQFVSAVEAIKLLDAYSENKYALVYLDSEMEIIHHPN